MKWLRAGVQAGVAGEPARGGVTTRVYAGGVLKKESVLRVGATRPAAQGGEDRRALREQEKRAAAKGAAARAPTVEPAFALGLTLMIGHRAAQ